MLTFESPFYEIEGVVVFRDHADSTLFHYLSGPPRLTRDERDIPSLQLLKYREALDTMAAAPETRDQLGGGFLMLGVDCGLSEEKKDDVRRGLESLLPPGSGPAKLAPVLYTKGTVSIIALDAQRAAAGVPAGNPAEHSRFVRGIRGTAVPSLLQDQRAIFSLSLSADAATLIEEAYESDLSPVGVMYELEFAGLRPAIAVKAHVDRRRVYEQLKTAFHAGFRTGGAQPVAAAGTPGRSIDAVLGGSRDTSEAAEGGEGTLEDQGSAGSETPAEGVAPAEGDTAAEGGAPAEGETAEGETAAGGDAPAEEGGSGTDGGEDSGEAGTAEGAATGGTSDEDVSPGDEDSVTEGSITVKKEEGSDKGTASKRDKPSTGGGVGVALSVDIGKEVVKLQQSGAIQIEIVRQQEGKTVDEMQKMALDLVKEVLIGDFFKPAMSATPSPVQAAAGALAMANQLMATSADTSKGTARGGTQFELGFQLQIKEEEELTTADLDFTVVAPETRTHAPNGFFSALVGQTERDEHIRTIDLDDPFFKRIDVDLSTTADFEAFDLKTILVDLQYGGDESSPRVVGAAVLTPTDPGPEHFQAFRDQDDFTYRYRVGYKFGQSERVAAQRQDYQTPWRPSMSRALVVHPPEDVAIRRVFVEPGVVDWDVVERVETRLVYDDPANGFHAERTFLVDQTSPRQEWIVRASDPALTSYRVKHRWHLQDQSEIEGEEAITDVAQLFVGDPFVDRLPIVLQPLVDRTNVVRVDVELQYQDPDHALDVRKNVELLGPDFRPVTVTIPIIDPDLREYTYRATLIKVNGSAESQAQVITDRLSIAITEGGIYFDVEVLILGKMEDHGIQAIQVDLRSEPLEGDPQRIESHLFEPGGESRVSTRLLLRADRPQALEYRTMVFRADGEPVEGAWSAHTSSKLVLQPARLAQG